MKRILDTLLNILCYPLVAFLEVTGWWSNTINGVEPKSGQNRYEHKTVDGVKYYRHAGLRYRFSKWKETPKPSLKFGDLDVCSMYPNVIVFKPSKISYTPIYDAGVVNDDGSVSFKVKGIK